MDCYMASYRMSLYYQNPIQIPSLNACAVANLASVDQIPLFPLPNNFW